LLSQSRVLCEVAEDQGGLGIRSLELETLPQRTERGGRQHREIRQ